MAAPFIYVALGAGKAIYKLANTPAGKEALKKFMSKKNPYGIKQIKPSDLPKNILSLYDQKGNPKQSLYAIKKSLINESTSLIFEKK